MEGSSQGEGHDGKRGEVENRRRTKKKKKVVESEA